MENYQGAAAKIGTLNLEKLSPYERGTVERILFSISYAQDKFEEARGHLQKAIDSGGLNTVQIDEAKYQAAQLYMQEEKWKEGAAALEEWFKTAATPNSAAYYLLAVAYYQQEDFTKALAPAKKAVELMDKAKPNESWLSMLSALYLQREEYKEAIPVLQQLVTAAPDKKTYWMQMSSVYGQMEDYANALAIMQLANNVGLVTEDAEVRRLADLLLFNDVPYRGAQTLEAAMEKKIVNLDDKLYEKLANCWIAAGEYERAIPPLTRAAEMASNGDAFIRLGEGAGAARRLARGYRGRSTRCRQRPAQGSRQCSADARHRALQPEGVRRSAAVLRARASVGQASADRGQLPAGHQGSGLIDSSRNLA
jgi:tetratricopeptide (TPR) repeat protein